MEPTYETGDFVVAREADSYEIGDVIVYRVPEGNAGAGRLIVHRVIDGDIQSGFITQGDNRGSPDQWHPTEKEVVGKLWFHVPNAASALPYLRSPVVLAGFFGALTLLFIVFRDEDEDEKEEKETDEEPIVEQPGPTPGQPAPLRIPSAQTIQIPPSPAARRGRASRLIGAGVFAALVGYLVYRRRL